MPFWRAQWQRRGGVARCSPHQPYSSWSCSAGGHGLSSQRPSMRVERPSGLRTLLTGRGRSAPAGKPGEPCSVIIQRPQYSRAGSGRSSGRCDHPSHQSGRNGCRPAAPGSSPTGAADRVADPVCGSRRTQPATLTPITVFGRGLLGRLRAGCSALSSAVRVAACSRCSPTAGDGRPAESQVAVLADPVVRLCTGRRCRQAASSTGRSPGSSSRLR